MRRNRLVLLMARLVLRRETRRAGWGEAAPIDPALLPVDLSGWRSPR